MKNKTIKRDSIFSNINTPNPQMIAGNERKLERFDSVDEIERYTTFIRPSLLKQIKQRALDEDIKIYELIEKALHQYLK